MSLRYSLQAARLTAGATPDQCEHPSCADTAGWTLCRYNRNTRRPEPPSRQVCEEHLELAMTAQMGLEALEGAPNVPDHVREAILADPNAQAWSERVLGELGFHDGRDATD